MFANIFSFTLSISLIFDDLEILELIRIVEVLSHQKYWKSLKISRANQQVCNFSLKINQHGRSRIKIKEIFKAISN